MRKGSAFFGVLILGASLPIEAFAQDGRPGPGNPAGFIALTFILLYSFCCTLGLHLLCTAYWPDLQAALAGPSRERRWLRGLIGFVVGLILFGSAVLLGKVAGPAALVPLTVLVALAFLGLGGEVLRIARRLDPEARPARAVLLGWTTAYFSALVPVVGWAYGLWLLSVSIGGTIICVLRPLAASAVAPPPAA